MATIAPTDSKPATGQPQPQPQAPGAPTNPQTRPDDVNEWVTRLKTTVADPSPLTNPTGAAPWTSDFFACFSPLDSCLLTYFCPCVMFGKTHHRLRGRDMGTWSPINASCLGWYFAACCGFHCLPTMMQRAEIRERGVPRLRGDVVTDCLKAWCCHCCDLMQQDKEVEALIARGALVVQEPGKSQGMSYAPA